MDDVYVIQAVPYVDWQGAAGVTTEKFALAPRASYTLEWAVYPTDSGEIRRQVAPANPLDSPAFRC